MEPNLSYDELALERASRQRTAILRRPAGRRRDSSIVGIYNDALRHKDGSLTVAYHVEMPATMFADDALIDARYDDLARMLAFDKPAGTLIQFRYTTISDPGYTIINLISSRATDGTHPLASLLQASNIDYVKSCAKDAPYRRGVLTIWVRVPPQRRANSTISAMTDFKEGLRSEIKANGFGPAIRKLPAIYASTADDAVVRRTVEDEKRNYSFAQGVWRQIENSSPLAIRRFTRQEIWEAVFFGNCQNAGASPMLPNIAGRDLRDYLCRETIEGELNYLMHGQYPVAIVSMFTPPNEFVTADALRGLIGRRDFNTRHTILLNISFPSSARKRSASIDALNR
jgi:hypothetical protein